MNTPYTTSRRVEYAQTDAAGIVHYTEYFKYMESAEHEFFRSINASVSMLHGDRHLSWPRVSCSFDFLQPLYFEDEFDIELSVERLGGKSVTFLAHIIHDGKPIATGKSTSVCCEMDHPEGMRSVAIPEDLREKISQIVVNS